MYINGTTKLYFTTILDIIKFLNCVFDVPPKVVKMEIKDIADKNNGLS